MRMYVRLLNKIKTSSNSIKKGVIKLPAKASNKLAEPAKVILRNPISYQDNLFNSTKYFLFSSSHICVTSELVIKQSFVT